MKHLLFILAIISFSTVLEAKRMRPVTPLDGDWHIVRLALKGKTIRLKDTDVTSVNINSYNKRINANLGCNTLNGNYETDEKSSLKFSNMIATEMFCEGKMLRENMFNKITPIITSYKISNDKMTLTFFNKRAIVMVLKRGLAEVKE
jgi:heat shock protein HslJ